MNQTALCPDTGLPEQYPLNVHWEMTPVEVEERLSRRGGEFLLVDCRTDAEWRLARIRGAVHVPMSELPYRLDELEDDADGCTVGVYCHHGQRSLQVTALLRSRGIDAFSMAGGIDAWSQAIDPSVNRY